MSAMEPNAADAVELNTEEEDPQKERTKFYRKLLGIDSEYNAVNYMSPTPMSEITRYYMWDDVREYPQPYHRRVYMTDKTDLSTNGWVQWISNRVDIILSEHRSNENVNIQFQVVPIGGENSMYRCLGENDVQKSSHSWRNEFTAFLVLDGFYNCKEEEAHQTVMQWIAENDECAKEGGIFCDEDRRVLWGSYGRLDDVAGGANLDLIWDRYYDSKEKYDKLVEIKRKVDPHYIFTANGFGVDASNAPMEKQPLILSHGLDNPESKNIYKKY